MLAEVLVEDDTGFETDGDSVLDPAPVAEVIVMITGELTVVDAVMLSVVERGAVAAVVADEGCVQLSVAVNDLAAVLLGRVQGLVLADTDAGVVTAVAIPDGRVVEIELVKALACVSLAVLLAVLWRLEV
jgi:hypothetical protein